MTSSHGTKKKFFQLDSEDLIALISLVYIVFRRRCSHLSFIKRALSITGFTKLFIDDEISCPSITFFIAQNVLIPIFRSIHNFDCLKISSQYFIRISTDLTYDTNKSYLQF